jgi:hypothetical protein
MTDKTLPGDTASLSPAGSPEIRGNLSEGTQGTEASEGTKGGHRNDLAPPDRTDGGRAAGPASSGGRAEPPRAEGETDRQYEVFLWRVRDPELTHAALAKMSGVSETSVRRWSSRFRWRERLAEPDGVTRRERIELATAAAERVAAMWAERAAVLRAKEWSAAEELLAAATRLLRLLQSSDGKKSTLFEVARALEVASRLGRMASGLATEQHQVSGPGGGAIRVQFEAALDKVYGPKAEVIDVEATAEGGDQ